MAKQPTGKLKKLTLTRALEGPQGLAGAQGLPGTSGTMGPVGPQGDVGPQGPTGLSPEHHWVGNKLQFKEPNGKWGKAADLTGPGSGAAGRFGSGYFPGGGESLTQSNLTNVVYLKGNEFTDGSVRLVVEQDIPEFQERKLGIWIPGELRLDASTLFLGRDVSIRGIGSHLQVNSNEANRTSLLLEVVFDDSGTEQPHTHILSPRQNRVVFVPNESGEIITSKFELAVTSFLSAFRYTYYFKSGSVAATQPVTLTITKGSVPGGALVFTKTMPASQWPVNTEVVIDLDGALSLSVGAPLLLTIESTANFSIVGDGTVAGTFFAMDFQTFSLEDVIAIPTGTNRFLVDNIGEMVVDDSGNTMMFGEQGSLSTTTPEPPFPPLNDPPQPGV